MDLESVLKAKEVKLSAAKNVHIKRPCFYTENVVYRDRTKL
jgi:hypothetical protein